MYHTTVHANTDKPYAEWVPVYVILSSWDKGTWRPIWLKWELYQLAKPDAEKMIEDFWKAGRWGERTYLTARWRKDICEAIVRLVNDNVEGLTCRVEYPPFEENHCRKFILTRK